MRVFGRDCHGEVKRDAFVTSPHPPLRRFPRRRVLGARARVRACPFFFSLALANGNREGPEAGAGVRPGALVFLPPSAASEPGPAPAARLRGHFRMFYSRDASGIVTRLPARVDLKVYFQNNRKSHYGSGSSTCLSISSGAVLCCKLASVRLHSACSCGQSLKFIILVDHGLPSDLKI